MKDVMLDFETLGNGKDKCLCQVGACYFDPVTGEIGDTLKINIDAESHTKYGGVLDASTVYWWLAQSDEARKSILEGDREHIMSAMVKLNEFISKAKRIWSHATFDFVTLMETFRQLNIKPTVSYRSGLDIRTLVHLAGISVSDTPRNGVHHDALSDCIHQVKYCVAALNVVKENKKIVDFINKIKN